MGSCLYKGYWLAILVYWQQFLFGIEWLWEPLGIMAYLGPFQFRLWLSHKPIEEEE